MWVPFYNRNVLNKELARSSFSWEAIRWWEAAKVYIADERRAHHDESLYSESEAFAKAMQKYEPPLSRADVKDFLAEEKTLETEKPYTFTQSAHAKKNAASI